MLIGRPQAPKISQPSVQSMIPGALWGFTGVSFPSFWALVPAEQCKLVLAKQRELVIHKLDNHNNLDNLNNHNDDNSNQCYIISI